MRNVLAFFNMLDPKLEHWSISDRHPNIRLERRHEGTAHKCTGVRGSDPSNVEPAFRQGGTCTTAAAGQ